jgi:hypothetical protein
MTDFESRLSAARRILAQQDVARPVGLADQYAAAERDARAIFDGTQQALEAMNFIARSGSMPADLERNAHLLAAVMDCRRCIHIQRSTSPMPVFALLNTRRLVCGRCIGTRYRLVDDDRCEVCHSTGHTVFTEFTARSGCIQIHGNAANCCRWIVAGHEAA